MTRMPAGPRARVIAAAAACLLGAASAARADTRLSVARKIIDLTPERIEAFKEALHEFATFDGDARDRTDLELISEYWLPEPSAWPGDGGPDDLGDVPWMRDAVADEEFFVAGREDEYEDAALDWVERRLKGSVASSRTKSRRGLATRLAWNHGPRVAVGRAPILAEVGADSWRVRWSQPVSVSAAGPWRLVIFVGEERDDGFQAGFTFGRNLLQAARRR